MSLLTGGRQKTRSGREGGRGTLRTGTAVARNAVRVVDAPLPAGGGAGLARQRTLDLAAATLAAGRPVAGLIAAALLSLLALWAIVALTTGRLGPLARIDLALVAYAALLALLARGRRLLTPAVR